RDNPVVFPGTPGENQLRSNIWLGGVAERPNAAHSKCVRRFTRLVGSNPTPSANFLYASGRVLERPNRHDWKSCVPHGTEGSNPSPSAKTKRGFGSAETPLRVRRWTGRRSEEHTSELQSREN